MKIEENEILLETPFGQCFLSRNEHGVIRVRAEEEKALYFGNGFAQLNDRQLQAYQLRIIFTARAAQCLQSKLLNVDIFINRFPFDRDFEEQEKKLTQNAQDNLDAFIAGMNYWQETEKPAWEWFLIGYKPEPWERKDIFAIVNGFGYLGLADGQAKHESLIIEMIRNGVETRHIREIFPHITEDIPHREICAAKFTPMLVPKEIKWLKAMPDFKASNNWAVSGKKSANGHALFANDPHLQIDRIPSIWQECILDLNGRIFKGFGVPGIPGGVVGRTPDLSWGPTYSYLDSMDFYIEEIKDGCYRREDQWIPLEVREASIAIKGKKQAHIQNYYETDLGLLENYNGDNGYYFSLNYSAARDTGAAEINGIMDLFHAQEVKEGMAIFRAMESPSFSWVLADHLGNIGFQMSGRAPKRPRGQSGAIPQPAWDKEKHPKGFILPVDLPSQYNPKENYIVTANEDKNDLGNAPVCSLPMASYRADRIHDLLREREDLTLKDMEKIQTDLYSIQAGLFIDQLLPLLPKTGNGDILRTWDFRYNKESLGAPLFELAYKTMFEQLIGSALMGKEVMDQLWDETGTFNALFGYFDDVMLREECSFFTREKKQAVLAHTVLEVMKAQAKPMGSVRRIPMKHIFFGDQLPGFLGFDKGPYAFEGSRATVNQGQFYRSSGRNTSFCPSYRMVCDAEAEEIHTCLIGGSTDRRFSKWYSHGIDDYLQGKYKVY